jgi:hypothetical protein
MIGSGQTPPDRTRLDHTGSFAPPGTWPGTARRVAAPVDARAYHDDLLPPRLQDRLYTRKATAPARVTRVSVARPTSEMTDVLYMAPVQRSAARLANSLRQ